MARAETRDPHRPSDLRTPALVVLAVGSVLEGYASLGTIGAAGFVVGPAGAALFALGCLALAIGLTRPSPGARHTSAERYLLCAATLLVATTLAIVVGIPGLGHDAIGASELLVAVAALAAASSGERRSVRRRHAATHPSRVPRERVTASTAPTTAAVAPSRSPRRFG
jgi:hypothetical protein